LASASQTGTKKVLVHPEEQKSNPLAKLKEIIKPGAPPSKLNQAKQPQPGVKMVKKLVPTQQGAKPLQVKTSGDEKGRPIGSTGKT